jgi:hypothetical protein
MSSPNHWLQSRSLSLDHLLCSFQAPQLMEHTCLEAFAACSEKPPNRGDRSDANGNTRATQPSSEASDLSPARSVEPTRREPAKPAILH